MFLKKLTKLFTVRKNQKESKAQDLVEIERVTNKTLTLISFTHKGLLKKLTNLCSSALTKDLVEIKKRMTEIRITPHNWSQIG